MNSALIADLYRRINDLPILDIHTHVEWKTGTAQSIGDILSYHYYTELTNSAEFQGGKFPFEDPKALTREILPKLSLIKNTVQYDWLMTISRDYLGIPAADWKPENWERIYDRSVDVMGRPEWRDEMIKQSNIIKVFLTNEFDDDFEGMDSSFYAPCLRTESFIIWIDRPAIRDGFAQVIGRPVKVTSDVVEAMDKTFARFVKHGMGYAAMSIPTGFQTFEVADEDAQRILDKAIAGGALDCCEMNTWSAWAMNRVCDHCRKYKKPFHLMIGVNRDTYEHGVPRGTDLVDSVNSMRGYDYVLNTYWDVDFPTAVLSDTTGMELMTAAWIRHNVYPSGHWWYSNQPTDIAREIRRRINAVPGCKNIGYFSDAYYLEFILPKFRMYKFELASALAERMERSLIHPNMEPFSLDDAMQMAEDMLLNNPARIIGIQGL